ncbi:hypothetical protein C8Q75DRAFT_380206 [Abortiporus biennis]|nr:hypothetical protein C8Q75DRAFT_380206 [Abortiporus biennis]
MPPFNFSTAEETAFGDTHGRNPFKECKDNPEILAVLLEELRVDSSGPIRNELKPDDEAKFIFTQGLFLHVTNHRQSFEGRLTQEESEALAFSELPLALAEVATESWSHLVPKCPRSNIPDYTKDNGTLVLLRHVKHVLVTLSRFVSYIKPRREDLFQKLVEDALPKIWSMLWKEIQENDGFSYIFIGKDVIAETASSSADMNIIWNTICDIHESLLELADEYLSHCLKLESEDKDRGHLPHVLMFLWLYSMWPQWPMPILSGLRGSQIERIQDAVVDIDSDIFARRAVQHFIADFRDGPS